jgi:hypothetical protein
MLSLGITVRGEAGVTRACQVGDEKKRRVRLIA